MRQPTKLIAGLVVGVAGVATASNALFPTWKRDYAPINADYSSLSPEHMLFAFAGFRELIAGILWVKADSYFDEGNYDAILPIIRIVTYLDPHQIDVYGTGMWHIGYNFTDEGARSDRRYLPTAVALGAEGSKNNEHTYELFYETGWIYFHKIDDDYPQAVGWLEKAVQRKDMLTARRNLLNNVYQRNGDLNKALDYTYGLLSEAEKAYEKTKEFQERQNRDTIEGNFDNLLIRMGQRGWFAQQDGTFAQGQYDTRPPYDVGFSAQVTVVNPKVIRVMGTWNVQPVGTRIRCILRDADYPQAVPGGMQWNQGNKVELTPPKNQTFMQDQLFVKNQQFDRKIDMSRDLTMYSFSTNKYIVEFYYNPRSAPAHIQDKFGWNGEGMTDNNHLNTEIRKDQRVVYVRLELTRDQLLRRGEWEARVPVVKTSNFQPIRATGDGNVIVVPGLLSEPADAVGKVPRRADNAESGAGIPPEE